MKILVINGDCIQVNSSANLCHLAYLKGLLDSGHDITLLSADGKDYSLDPSMKIPEGIKCYSYYGVSFYEKLSLRKKHNLEGKLADTDIANAEKKQSTSKKANVIKKLKRIVLSLYGVHGIYAKFVKVAQKFYSDVEYDYIISISTPVTSHVLAYNLQKAGHIKGRHWIQIWEDPWYSDAYGFNGNIKIFNEEKRILSLAERICYVSPLTLENQKKLFPDSAAKMYWQPLPYYYKNSVESNVNYNLNSYGYFGEYVPEARNLKPFYDAACDSQINVNICGNPSNLFNPTNLIHIYPRMKLEELKPIEDETNVLIFLCNRKGGQIPGKIYQYSATNKVILFILDGTAEERKVIKEYFMPYNRYVFCENTKEDICRAISLIENGLWGNIKNEPVEDFNPRITIEKILKGI